MTQSSHPDLSTLINQLMITAQYKDGGRGPRFFDCWGLTRYARSLIFDSDMLPSYGHISADDKHRLTLACAEVIRKQRFSTCEAVPGAIATVWKNGVCNHIGLVFEKDDRKAVLEINKGSGIRAPFLDDFERLYADVRYYND
jgi:hypothetical protein